MINGAAHDFQSCSQTLFQIFIDGLQDWQVEESMYYSHTTYFMLRGKAYNKFADFFELQKGCKNLHIYVKIDTIINI